MIYSTHNGVAFGPIGSDAAQRIMAKQGADSCVAFTLPNAIGRRTITLDNGDTLSIGTDERAATGELLNSTIAVVSWATAVLFENRKRKLAADLAVNEGIN